MNVIEILRSNEFVRISCVRIAGDRLPLFEIFFQTRSHRFPTTGTGRGVVPFGQSQCTEATAGFNINNIIKLKITCHSTIGQSNTGQSNTGKNGFSNIEFRSRSVYPHWRTPTSQAIAISIVLRVILFFFPFKFRFQTCISRSNFSPNAASAMRVAATSNNVVWITSSERRMNNVVCLTSYA